MNRFRIADIFKQFALLACVLIMAVYSDPSWAQSSNETEAEAEELLSEAEIEQLVASIALHPDALLSQILMASTYPLEVVEAARWVEANPDVKDDALETAMAEQDWDPSVKALTPYPTVLDMMNAELSWTQQLGDAFLAQQEDVLAAVQRLRQQAKDAGNLESTEQITYTEEEVTTDAGSTTTVIVAQPAKPEVVYVPAYDPTVVYGAWRYPAYPPYYYYPPGYNVARGVFWFSVGYAVGNNWWGGCNWGSNKVNINVNVYNRNRYTRNKINNPNWRHNPRHRKAVPYRHKKVANQYRKRPQNMQQRKSREQFRGRAEAGRRDLAKRPAGQRPAQRPAAKAPAKRPAAQRPAQRPAAKAPAKRPAAKAPAKRPSNAKRPQQRKQPAAYKGVGKGKSVRSHSSRGKQSRGASRPKRRGGGGRRR
jgi:hypothetical protein